jgi:tetratricopeptide (TPR) repeat protein
MNELDFSEITRLNEKFSKDPKSRIFVQLADLYRKNNMIDEALDVLNKGFEFHPDYPVAYLIQGKCYHDKRSYVQARDAFEKTIALDPQNIVALRMLAKTCEILKDERGQIDAYKSIVAIDPLDANAKERLSMLEALQRKEPMYTVAMAEEYEKQGNHEEAVRIYEHLLYTDPSDLTLNQKVSELKKAISDQKKKIEEAKIEDMKVEPVFKTEELATEKEPDKIQIESFDEQQEAAKTAATDNEIQSLEDFLVEELEQAAEKKAAQEHGENPPLVIDERIEQITPSPEKTEEMAAPEPEPEVTERPPETDDRQEPVVEETKPGESEPIPGITTETPVETIMRDVETEQTAPATEPPQPEPIPVQEQEPASEPIPAPEPVASIQEPPSPEEEPLVTESTHEPEESAAPIAPPEATPLPAEEPPAETGSVTASEESRLPEPTPTPEPAEPEAAATAEQTEKIEEPEGPKKPNEEDFQSFQDWLSGLLK